MPNRTSVFFLNKKIAFPANFSLSHNAPMIHTLLKEFAMEKDLLFLQNFQIFSKNLSAIVGTLTYCKGLLLRNCFVLCVK